MVEKGLAPSRSKAQALIRSGNVLCNGRNVTKTGLMVSEADHIEVTANDLLKYVSRGGLKLEKAIAAFHLDLNGKRILDIGSSTGGFTDCALQHGAAHVIAVDVGRDVMDADLRKDERIELHEQTDIRDLPLEKYRDIDYAVCDVSFISLLKIMKPLAEAEGDFEMILLIKPQFECGPEAARKYKGIILNKEIHHDVLARILRESEKMGIFLQEITWSPVSGGDGNIEYISRFVKRGSARVTEGDLDNVIREAFKTVKKNR